MDEHEADFEPLIEEKEWYSPEAWLTPTLNPNLLRGCRYARHQPGKWSFWVGDVRWDLLLRPQRRLFRQGEVIGGIGQVMCLDDAVLFALGYEEGLQDMARERKEGPS